MRTVSRSVQALGLVLSVLLGAPAVAGAQAVKAGVVTTAEGQVTARRVVLPQPVPLKFKDDVFLQDTVVTGERSLARLLLAGKAVVTVRERSALTVTEVPGRSTLDMDSGKIGLVVARDRMRPGEVIDIKTPNAIVAVRGTVLVVEVRRATAQAGAGAGAPTTDVYLLRDFAEVTPIDPATRAPIGPVVALSPMQRLTVTGTAPPRVTTFTTADMPQIAEGLQPTSVPHQEAANPEQVKGLLLDTTAAVLAAVTGTGPERLALAPAEETTPSAPPEPVEATPTAPPIIPEVAPALQEQAAAAPEPTPPPPTAPGDGVSPAPGPPPQPGAEISITGDFTIPAGQTLRSFSGSFTRSDTTPLIQVTNATVNQLGPQDLIEVLPGADVGLASPLLDITNSVVTAGRSLLRVEGTLTGTSPAGLIAADPSTISSAGDLIRVNPGGSIETAGPLLSAVDTAISTSPGQLLHVMGGDPAGPPPGSVDAGGTLLSFTRSTLALENNLVRLVDGGVLAGGLGAAPLVVFSDSRYAGGIAPGAVSGGSLLRMFSSVAGQGSSLVLSGPYLFAADSTFQGRDAPLFNIADGSLVVSSSTEPFALFERSAVSSASSFFNLETQTQFGPAPGVPLTIGSGDPAFIALAGTLVRGLDTTFDIGGTFLTLRDGVFLSQTGPAPLIDLQGSTPGGVRVTASENFFRMSAAAGRPAPVARLGLPPSPAGPGTGGTLLAARNATLATGDPTANGFSFIFVGDGADLVTLGAAPLLAFDNVALDTAGAVLSLRRSQPGNPSIVELGGPLLVAQNSSFNTTSLGFEATFGTSSACCPGFFIGQGARLTSSTPEPLIQLTSSVFNAGPDSQSGGTFFLVADTFTGAPGGELVAPATVSLAGPLLRATDSTISAAFDLLEVRRSSLSSSSPDPLIQLVGTTGTGAGLTTVTLGGTRTDPLSPGTIALGRLLDIVGSSTTPASLTLAGPLLDATRARITTSDDVVGIFDGASVVSSSPNPFVSLTDSSLTAAGTGNFLVLASNLGLPPSLTLAGPLLRAERTTLANGDPASNTTSFMFVGDGADLVTLGAAPLLAFDNVALDTAGNVLTLRRSRSDDPSTLTLGGPLLVARNSSFNTTSLGFGATFGPSSACCSGFFIGQGARLTSSTPEPLIQLTSSVFNAGPDAQSGGTLFTVADTFTGAPSGELVAPATVSLAGPLLRATDSTITAAFDLLAVRRSSLSSSSPDPLIQLVGTTGTGAGLTTVTLGGTRTDPLSPGTIALGHLLDIVGSSTTPASLTLAGPLLDATRARITTSGDVIRVNPGGSIETAGPLLSAVDTAISTSPGQLLHVMGGDPAGPPPGSVDAGGTLLSFTRSTLALENNLVRLVDGGVLAGGLGAAPLVVFSDSRYAGGIAPGAVSGGSLLRMFSSVAGQGSSLVLSGPYLFAADSTFQGREAPLFNIADGSLVVSSSTEPFALFERSAVSSASNFFTLRTQTQFGPAPGVPLTIGSGDPVFIALAGTLVRGLDTTFDIGDPTRNVDSFMFVGDGADLVTLGPAPLLAFDNVALDTAGTVLTLSRSRSDDPSTLTLGGPLLVAQNSSFNTTSLGFEATFGTSGACCSGFFIGQGARLTSSTPEPLIQLTSSVFNAGPDAQSGASFFDVVDTFTGAPSGELVAPATVSLAGPLLRATDSTITAAFDLLQVRRSTVSSTTTDPLIQLVGTTGTGAGLTTVTLGGTRTDPLSPGTTSFGRLLTVVSGPASGAPAPAASVSLAGPLLSATNAAITTTGDVILVLNGGTLSSTTTAPLVQLLASALTAGTGAVNGDLLDVEGTGGPSGTAFATVSLRGPLLTAVGSPLSLTGGLGVFAGGVLSTTEGPEPLAAITGGTHSIATNPGTAVFRLFGRPTATTTETIDLPELQTSVNLLLGTDRPVRGPSPGAPVGRPLFEASGATVNAQSVLRIDTALLEATLPALGLRSGSTLTSAIDAFDLSSRAKVSALGPLLTLDASTLNVTNGALIRLANGSFLDVAGDLLSLSNGSRLNLLNGSVLNVTGNSIARVGGAFVAFGGNGNQINITNSACAGAECVNFGSVRVALTGGATGANVSIGGNVIKGSGGVINYSSPQAAAIVVSGSGSRVVIRGQ